MWFCRFSLFYFVVVVIVIPGVKSKVQGEMGQLFTTKLRAPIALCFLFKWTKFCRYPTHLSSAVHQFSSP